MTEEQTAPQPTHPDPVIVDEQLYCSLTGRPISREEAYWAPPLITARQLVATIATTALRTPHQLGAILMAEQPNVPYAVEVREQLAQRRSAEQLKLLIGMLLILGLLVTPVLLLIAR